MRHPIDPKIDCVFKALLGTEDNRALLIHFLNAMLDETLPSPVTDVAILSARRPSGKPKKPPWPRSNA